MASLTDTGEDFDVDSWFSQKIAAGAERDKEEASQAAVVKGGAQNEATGVSQWVMNLPKNISVGLFDAAVNTIRSVGDLAGAMDSGAKAQNREARMADPNGLIGGDPNAGLEGKTPQQLREKHLAEPVSPIHSAVSDAVMSFRDSFAQSSDTPDQVTQGIAQFALPLLGWTKLLGGLSGASKIGTIAKAATAEAATVATAFDPQAPRAADLVQMGKTVEGKLGDSLNAIAPDGSALNAYIDYMTDRSDEGAVEGRFKNVVDSLGVSAAAAGLLKVGANTIKFAHGLPEYIAENAGRSRVGASAQRGAVGDLSRIEPAESKWITEDGTPVWEMNAEQLDAAIESAQKADHDLLMSVFGDEKTARWFNRSANSNSEATYAKAESLIEALPPEKRKVIEAWERGENGSKVIEPDLKYLRRAVGDLSAQSPEELARNLKYALTDIGDQTDPALMDSKQLGAYMQLRQGLMYANSRGWDTAKIGNDALKAAAARFSDPEDAAFMLDRFLGKTRAALPAPDPVHSLANASLQEHGDVPTALVHLKERADTFDDPALREQHYAAADHIRKQAGPASGTTIVESPRGFTVVAGHEPTLTFTKAEDAQAAVADMQNFYGSAALERQTTARANLSDKNFDTLHSFSRVLQGNVDRPVSTHSLVSTLEKNIKGDTEEGAFYKEVLGRLAGKRLGGMTTVTAETPSASIRGRYFVDSNAIKLHPGAFETPRTLVHSFTHEVVHAATMREMKEAPAVYGAIEKLRKQVSDYYQENAPRTAKTPMEGDKVKEPYGFTDPYEFVAEIESNPEFRASMKKAKIGGASIWDQYKKVIAGILGITGLAVNPEFDEVDGPQTGEGYARSTERTRVPDLGLTKAIGRAVRAGAKGAKVLRPAEAEIAAEGAARASVRATEPRLAPVATPNIEAPEVPAAADAGPIVTPAPPEAPAAATPPAVDIPGAAPAVPGLDDIQATDPGRAPLVD
jgi:hypothetical protein